MENRTLTNEEKGLISEFGPLGGGAMIVAGISRPKSAAQQYLSSITYKPLYTQVNDLLKESLFWSHLRPLPYDDQLARDLLGPQMAQERLDATDSTYSTDLVSVIANYLPNQVRSGLDVVAKDPITDYVTVKAGEANIRGEIYTLSTNTDIRIPFDETTQTFYVLMYKNSVRIDQTVEYEDLKLAEIVVPKPGTTALVRDKFDAENPWDAYIVMDMQYYLYGDLQGNLSDDTIELMRNNIGDILADNLIGNIRLSENLKVINTAGTVEIDSNQIMIKDTDGNILSRLNKNGVYFYNYGGVEISRFTAYDAKMGNIEITPSTLESSNFLTNVSGFRIQDNGNAEFNDVKVRGSIYTSVIEENLYVTEGVSIIGNVTFEGAVQVNAGDKLVFDADYGADTYWVYNVATGYLEGWVDGVKRIEL